jgi:glycyl-tRNA synthetase beta chain
MPQFLLEIGCEEIPARMIDAGAAELARRVSELVSRERLGSEAAVTSFATPRRLSVLVSGVEAAQPDVQEKVMGPSTKVAFKDGQPAPPAHAFAKKVGIDLSQVERVTTAKGEYLAATVTKRGRNSAEILSENLPKEISSLYWPKNMYWRKRGELFVRPVRWVVAMLDDQVIPLELDGVAAGKISRGHRIIGKTEVEISHARNYVTALQDGKVLGREERLTQVRKLLDAQTRGIPGARWREDAELLETVVNLTEFPSVILGNLDREFLELPEEVLVTVMRDHQKYFAIEDENHKLLPHFLAVLDTDGDPTGVIQHGNERVLRARFNDARFFWQTDQKHPLRERSLWLKNVTFQKDLGNYYDKMQRVQHLCSWICEILRDQGMTVRPGIVHKAAYLAKADLTTELVKEFTELQGIVGGLYARVQELDPDLPINSRLAVADAIYDQYKPESMDDSVPKTIEGAVLSIGDKADSIAGMFALGLIPSGSKDPFALRRQANAVVKILVEYKLAIPFSELSRLARAAYPDPLTTRKTDRLEVQINLPAIEEHIQQMVSFFRERLEFYLRDHLNFKYDVVNATLSAGADNAVDVIARARAVKEVRDLPDFLSIAMACKRIRNILKQAKDRGIRVPSDFRFLTNEAEEAKMLHAKIKQMAPRIADDKDEKDYVSALLMLSTLRDSVDTFFEKVMVMVEDESLRANRLALMATLLREFSTIADFSEIVTEGKV